MFYLMIHMFEHHKWPFDKYYRRGWVADRVADWQAVERRDELPVLGQVPGADLLQPPHQRLRRRRRLAHGDTIILKENDSKDSKITA